MLSDGRVELLPPDELPDVPEVPVAPEVSLPPEEPVLPFPEPPPVMPAHATISIAQATDINHLIIDHSR